MQMMSTTYDNVRENAQLEYLFAFANAIWERDQRPAIFPAPFNLVVFASTPLAILFKLFQNLRCRNDEPRRVPRKSIRHRRKAPLQVVMGKNLSLNLFPDVVINSGTFIYCHIQFGFNIVRIKLRARLSSAG